MEIVSGPQPSLPFEGKACTACGGWKPLTEFGKQASTKDGLKFYCRACVKVRNAATYTAKRDEYQARHREYYQANSEAFKQRARRDYRADPEGKKQAVRDWQKRNPKKKAAYSAKWVQANLSGKVRENTRRRYARRKGAFTIPFTPEQLAQKSALWGHRCWVCRGEPNSWDHVKPLVAGGAHILANLRPICRSCNSSKRERWPFPLKT